MADPRPPIAGVIGLPPEETVRAFEARDDLRVTVRWSEMWHQDHARAFTVAKVAKLDLLADIQAAVADVAANGGTFDDFQRNLVPTLQQAGWWGQVNDPALTGTADTVNIGPRRLRTIYDTNMRVSRAAGHWTRIQALKQSRPFLRYSAVLDRRTRPAHRAWHGTILPVDHPWWDTHYPPCGWFCRCNVIQLSQRDLDRNGWSVSDVPPEGPPVPFLRAGTTVPELVPAGISPGFAYNAGKASMQAVAEKAIATLERTALQDLANARSTLAGLVTSDAFLETLSEPGAAFPVMVLDNRLRTAIGANNSVVVLSSDNYQKQIGNRPPNPGHPEIGVDQYRQLPAIGASPDHVVKDRDQHLVLMAAADNKYLRAAIKTTSDGNAMFLLSLRYAEASEVAALLAKFMDLIA